jgi:hypothetical protein
MCVHIVAYVYLFLYQMWKNINRIALFFLIIGVIIVPFILHLRYISAKDIGSYTDIVF